MTEREYVSKSGAKVKSLPNLGWDFTFSAPKSVSVLWSQGTPEIRATIEKCHERAVEKAVEHLEKSIYIRSGRGGKVSEKASPIFGAFTHSTSRSLDPQLHDHVILINTAIGPHGRGGAVDARPLFREIHMLGNIYRNELRRNLENELKVRTVDRKVGRENGFEVWGIPGALLKDFSKRRASIELEIWKLEMETGRKATVKEVQAITKATRGRKEIPNREELFSEWRERGRAAGFSLEAFLKAQKGRTFTRGEEKAFVREVSYLLSYRDRITERDVFAVSLSVARGRIGTDEVKEFTRNYISSYLTEVGVRDGVPHYAFTREGMRKVSERPRYTEFCRAINRAVTRTRSALYERRANKWERKNRAFKVRITVAYAIGRIDRKTYKRLTSKETPKSKAYIEFLYATHQISKRQREFFLKRLDPNVEKKRALEREEFVRRKEEKEKTADYLYIHGLIDKPTRDDLKKGKISLHAVTRNIERKGESPKGKSDDTKKEPQKAMKNPVYSTIPFSEYITTADDGRKANHFSLLNVYEVKEKSGPRYAVIYQEYRYQSPGTEHSRPEVIEEHHWGTFSKSEALRKAEEGRLAIERAVMKAAREKKRMGVAETTLGREPGRIYESPPYGVRSDKSRETYCRTSVEKVGRSYSVIERKYEHKRVSGTRTIEENERGVYESLERALGAAVSNVQKGSRDSTYPAEENRKEKERSSSPSL
jgi:conjugative relaxase-like TrwC/TraI family protein